MLIARRPRALILAGLLGGTLVWLRPANAALMLAAVVALLGAGWRGRVLRYSAGALPVLAGLPLWQWRIYGSPLTSGYQAAQAGADNSAALESFFSWRYVVGTAWSSSGQPWLYGRHLANPVAYVRVLAGDHAWLTLPGVALLGLIAALCWLRRADACGQYARFTLAALAATLAIYLLYYWQDPRFLVVPMALLNLSAAVALARFAARVARAVAPLGPNPGQVVYWRHPPTGAPDTAPRGTTSSSAT